MASASPSGAPLFAAWRALDAPSADRTKARAQYPLNALRELRGALHGGAVLAAGLTGQEAVAYRAPHMAGIFGWDPENLPDAETVKDRWKIAEAGTDAAFGVALGSLDDAERAELVELVTALHGAVVVGQGGLNMDVREALYTTRAMCRVTSEPIPMDVQTRILDAAVRAPSGGNTENCWFLLSIRPRSRLGSPRSTSR